MARYIDADELYKKLYPLDLADKRTYTINAKAVADAITNIPSTDVVPKSEVEELNRECESLGKTVNEASELIRKLRSKIDELKKDRYQVFPDGKIELLPRTDIDEIKRDAAREIFEEIETELNEALKNNYARRNECNAETDLAHSANITGKITCLRGLTDFIAELKKKYTEGE